MLEAQVDLEFAEKSELICPAADPFRYLLEGTRCEETTFTVHLDPRQDWNKMERYRLAEYSGGAWLERRGNDIVLGCRNGTEIKVTQQGRDRHRATDGLRVAEAEISPDQRMLALVVVPQKWRQIHIPNGFIVVYDLNGGQVLARLPIRTISSAYFGM